MQVVELAHVSSQGHTLCYIIINKSEVAQFSISHMEVVTSGEIRICARFKNKWKKVMYSSTQFQQCRANVYFLPIINTFKTAPAGNNVFLPFDSGRLNSITQIHAAFLVQFCVLELNTLGLDKCLMLTNLDSQMCSLSQGLVHKPSSFISKPFLGAMWVNDNKSVQSLPEI